jgi:hypothetical protein
MQIKTECRHQPLLRQVGVNGINSHRDCQRSCKVTQQNMPRKSIAADQRCRGAAQRHQSAHQNLSAPVATASTRPQHAAAVSGFRPCPRRPQICGGVAGVAVRARRQDRAAGRFRLCHQEARHPLLLRGAPRVEGFEQMQSCRNGRDSTVRKVFGCLHCIGLLKGTIPAVGLLCLQSPCVDR